MRASRAQHWYSAATLRLRSGQALGGGFVTHSTVWSLSIVMLTPMNGQPLFR